MAVARSRSADTLDEVLDGHVDPGVLRQIAVDPLRHGLADLLVDRFADVRSWELELLRTKYKPSRKLTAYYRIAGGASAGGDGSAHRHLAVSWSAHPPPESRITALVSPADPAMPQLRRLTQRGHLVELLEALTCRKVASATSSAGRCCAIGSRCSPTPTSKGSRATTC